MRTKSTAITCWLAALLLASPAGAQETREASSQPLGQCTLVFRNGDKLRGAIDAIAGGVISFRPSVSEGQLSINAATVSTATFEKPPQGPGEKPATQGGDVLRLRDGSWLGGKFLQLTDLAVRFELETFGPIDVPLWAVRELGKSGAVPATEPPAGRTVGPAAMPAARRAIMLRGGAADVVVGPNEGFAVLNSDVEPGATVKPIPAGPPAPAALPDRFCITTASGDQVVGDLRQQDDGLLVVSGAAVEARLPYASVAAIRFPDVPTATAPAAAKGLHYMVATRTGSILLAKDLRLAAGRADLTMAAGPALVLPVEVLARLTFTSTGLAKDAVLVWGPYSDRQAEVALITAALRANLGADLRVVEHHDAPPSDAFRAALLQARALVLLPMSRLNRVDAVKAAEQLKGLTDAFCAEGGTVVLLHMQEQQLDFVRLSGLLNTRVVSTITGSGMAFRFTEQGRELGKGLGEGFSPGTETINYSVPEGGVALATWAHGGSDGAQIVGRKIGRGWAILLGRDCTEGDNESVRLLINAVNFGQPPAP